MTSPLYVNVSQWIKIKMPLDPCVPFGLFIYFGTAAITKVRFLANGLLKGHQRSLEATKVFFVNYS